MDRRASYGRAAGSSALLLWALALSAPACSGAPPALALEPSAESLRDALPARALEELGQIRAAIDAGSLPPARARLEALAAEFPAHIGLSILLQEAEFASAASEHEPLGHSAAAAGEAAQAELLARWTRTAEAGPSPSAWILVARLETDPERALAALELALALEPNSAWAHYGRAHALARLERSREARESLDRALGLDPVHLGARRLDVALRARAGEIAAARERLQAWLELAETSPFVAAGERAEAWVDHAILDVLAGEAEEAESCLRSAAALGPRDPSRLELVRAAAAELDRRPEQALAAAGRAGEIDSRDPLPEVHRALLAEFWLGDLEAARAAWRAVLSRLGEPRQGSNGASLRGFLLKLQASARLARIEAELARRPARSSAGGSAAAAP